MSDRYLTDQVIDFLYRERVINPGDAAEHRTLDQWKKWIKDYVLDRGNDNAIQRAIIAYARGAIIPGFYEALDLEALKKKQAKIVAKFQKESR